MLIKSKFHDYYDSIGKSGIDKTIVFLRETQELPIPKQYKYLEDLIAEEYKTSHFDTICLPGQYIAKTKLVFFCGKIYPFCQYEYMSLYKEKHISYGQEMWDHPIIRGTVHTLDDIPPEVKLSSKLQNSWYNTSTIRGVFNHEFLKKDWVDLHREFKTPIIMVDRKYHRNNPRIVLNPCLKDFHFQTIKDTFTTFQDIQMYISGVLGLNERPMVPIEDIYRIEMHGFDKKESFRKGKTKHK